MSTLEELIEQFAAAERAGKALDKDGLYKAAGATVKLAGADSDEQLLRTVALLGLGDCMGAIAVIAQMALEGDTDDTATTSTDSDPLDDLDDTEDTADTAAKSDGKGRGFRNRSRRVTSPVTDTAASSDGSTDNKAAGSRSGRR